MRAIGALPVRRIAAQRHHVPNALVPVGARDVENLAACGADTGEVWRAGESRLPLDARHDAVGALARRAIGAVGHRHEARHERRQALERAPQGRLHRGVRRREELERNPDRIISGCVSHAAPSALVTCAGRAASARPTAASTCAPSASIGLSRSQCNPAAPRSRRNRASGCSMTLPRAASSDS